MSLEDKINSDYISAYKNHEALRVSALRLLTTAITNQLVELKKPGGKLDDTQIMDILLKQAKQRRDSIEQYIKAGREDLAQKEEAELKILEDYLPKPLSEDELKVAIDAAIQATAATGMQDMGKVMASLTADYKGRMDGKTASALVRQKLSQA